MTERYLLDTNALSAMRDPRKNPESAAFLLQLDRTSLWISVLTLGELRRGLTIKRGRHGDVSSLERWINQMERDYAEQTLGVDLETAKLWGTMSSHRTRPAADTLIAATAKQHGLTVVTRNVKDYEDLPVRVLNPWQS
jgi:predicted nucleic acid-binding protein